MPKLRRPENTELWDKHYGGKAWYFKCPGCKEDHVITEGKWKFNGDINSPTFSPSLLVHSVNKDNPDYFRCHSYIRDGMIQFLNDCTHELKGQTVPLLDIPNA